MDCPGCDNTCFWRRLATAVGLVRAGAWASGHAIAAGLLDCARHGGCEAHADCAAAAQAFIDDVRLHLAPDSLAKAAG